LGVQGANFVISPAYKKLADLLKPKGFIEDIFNIKKSMYFILKKGNDYDGIILNYSAKAGDWTWVVTQGGVEKLRQDEVKDSPAIYDEILKGIAPYLNMEIRVDPAILRKLGIN